MLNKVLVNAEPNQFGYVHEGFIEADIVISKIASEDMVFKCDINEFEPSVLLSEVFKYFRDDIIGWLRNEFDETVDQDEDGIDDWWGFGSYMICELCLKIDVKYSDGPTILVIKK